MRITPLASGSLGNSLLVESGRHRLLVDAGLEVDELEGRLRSVGVEPGRIDALFVTHRHRDHVRAATELSRRHRVAIYATRRTARAIGSEAQRRVRRIEPLRSFEIGPLRAVAVPIEHDAPETVALLLESDGLRYGHVTDLGRASGPIVDYLERCDGLFVEFNHDERMLWDGDDPWHLKRRIASERGHLSNRQAAELLGRLSHDRLRQVWLAHLSSRNNRPELALDAARHALATAEVASGAALAVARQERASPTVELA